MPLNRNWSSSTKKSKISKAAQRTVQKELESRDDSWPTRFLSYCAVDPDLAVDVALEHKFHWAAFKSCGRRRKFNRDQIKELREAEGVDSLPCLEKALSDDLPTDGEPPPGALARWKRSTIGCLRTSARLFCSWYIRMALSYNQVSVLMNAFLFFAVFGSLITSISGTDLYVEFAAVVLLFAVGIVPSVVVELLFAVMYTVWSSIALKELGIETTTEKVKQRAKSVAGVRTLLRKSMAPKKSRV